MKYFDAFSGYGGFSLGIQRAYGKERRELLCESCDQEYSVWFTQNELWNKVCGIDGKNIGDLAFLCPNCFIKKSEAIGVGGIWEVKLKTPIYVDRAEQAEQGARTEERLSSLHSESRNERDEKPDCIGFSEIDKYAVQTYSKHFPTHKNYGSITDIDASTIPDFDLFVGGFPCQAFSIAGKRGGFEDTRGTLIYDVLRIVKEKHPRLVLLENVKGLLSHDNGRTFKTIITALAELGYAVEWQVLNAKNFGVPQNRERVFIVGHLGGFSGRQVFPITESSGKGIEELTTGASQGYRVYSPTGINTTLASQAGGVGAKTGLVAPTIRATEYKHGDNQTTIAEDGLKIRRLTPIECERLMGLPDGWTAEGTEGKISDTQRYKLCGNGVVVSVVEEIMKRLKIYERRNNNADSGSLQGTQGDDSDAGEEGA